VQATTAVLAAFMAGLGCGSLAFGTWLDRRRPSALRAYAVMEWGIALSASRHGRWCRSRSFSRRRRSSGPCSRWSPATRCDGGARLFSAENHDVLSDTRLRLIFNDGRNHLAPLSIDFDRMARRMQEPAVRRDLSDVGFDDPDEGSRSRAERSFAAQTLAMHALVEAQVSGLEAARPLAAECERLDSGNPFAAELLSFKP
jgi:hypothetical protein